MTPYTEWPRTAFVGHILRESPTPLSIQEIFDRVQIHLPEVTKKQISNALKANELVVNHDRAYHWRPRLLNGAGVRVVLSEADLVGPSIMIDLFAHELLALPTKSTPPVLLPRPIRLMVADGPTAEVTLVLQLYPIYMLQGASRLLSWICARGARPGDSLLITLLDGEAGLYDLRLEPKASVDQKALAASNQRLIDGMVEFVRKKGSSAYEGTIVAHMFNSGLFHHPVPPLGFDKLWTPRIWEPLALETGYRGFMHLDRSLFALTESLPPAPPPLPLALTPIEKVQLPLIYAPNGNAIVPLPNGTHLELPPSVNPEELADLLSQFLHDPYSFSLEPNHPLAEIFDQILASTAEAPLLADPRDLEPPPDLPRAYRFRKDGRRRSPRPLTISAEKPGAVYHLRLQQAEAHHAYRADLAIGADQTLEDLHLMIHRVLDWGDDALYSFFPTATLDPQSEIGSPWSSDTPAKTYQTRLSDLNLRSGSTFFYLFDYDAEVIFVLKVRKVQQRGAPGKYPQLLEERGYRPESPTEFWADPFAWADDVFGDEFFEEK